MYFQFQHPHWSELQRDEFIWNLSNVLLLKRYLHLLDGEPLKDVVEAVIHQYKTCVIPKRRHFHSCECHIDVVSSLPPYQQHSLP